MQMHLCRYFALLMDGEDLKHHCRDAFALADFGFGQIGINFYFFNAFFIKRRAQWENPTLSLQEDEDGRPGMALMHVYVYSQNIYLRAKQWGIEKLPKFLTLFQIFQFWVPRKSICWQTHRNHFGVEKNEKNCWVAKAEKSLYRFCWEIGNFWKLQILTKIEIFLNMVTFYDWKLKFESESIYFNYGQFVKRWKNTEKYSEIRLKNCFCKTMKPWKQIDEKYESLSQKRSLKKESLLESRVRRPTADLKILVYTNGGGKKLDILQ